MRKNSSKKKYFYAIGRRREATATVRLYIGKGMSLVNDKPIAKYFSGAVNKFHYQQPSVLTKTLTKHYATFRVKGGGPRGQLQAVVLALSRALQKIDREKYRPILKKAGLLTVDARARERRKAGQMGRARKKKQSPRR